jgi:phosphatidylglycerophosphate synthase
MFAKRYDFTLLQVTERLVLKSWWASFAILPLANRLVVLTANRTELTPNQITLVSCLLRLMSAVFFVNGADHWSLIVGGLCFQLAYLIDCVDGPVARLKGKTSELGRYLDHLSDLFGDIIILSALAWGQGMFFTPLVFGMIFMHIAESYISYLANYGLSAKNVSLEGQSTETQQGLLAIYLKYRRFFFTRNFKSFFSFPDYEAITLFLFPLFGLPALGLRVGFVLLMATCCYTIFSTFVSIHTGDSRFP